MILDVISQTQEDKYKQPNHVQWEVSQNVIETDKMLIQGVYCALWGPKLITLHVDVESLPLKYLLECELEHICIAYFSHSTRYIWCSST